MSLFSRNNDLPGLQAPVRDCTPMGKGMRKLGAGDIALIDATNINRAFAQQLIDAGVAAVLNIARAGAATVPSFGPQLLIDAGITLVDDLGPEVRTHFKDGKKGRLTDEGELFYGDKLLASGTVLSAAAVDAQWESAQQQLLDHMEAFFGNTTEFIRSEAPLLVDGLGIPATGVELDNRKVVVVSPAVDLDAQLKSLRNFLREYSPAIIAVNEAADTLVKAGYSPDIIIGDPARIEVETMRGGALMVLPADTSGHAIGMERIQDLGIGAMTFPSAITDATDLAILLAEYHGASLIVNVGAPIDLNGVFADAAGAQPSGLLARLKAGTKLVDGKAIVELYTVRSNFSFHWLWALLGVLVLIATIVAIAGFNGDGSFVDNLIDTWNNIAVEVRSWVGM
ncbi:putative cytokinetic ring protein SteA [Corynebacterium aquilae]|uniref:Thiamine pyrophosphokinase n=1 Tax=Corynebacterium aquilae DSM 44791 TaxID=1431546 RepID=A0A1L7CFU3_9CORY|nr:putative cytokinetic ring protein SteA [Corynebacterium aquilae]APT84696.1 thiamine pyrophosphokinase [Corynebacterium aquilae DSM 44791]